MARVNYRRKAQDLGILDEYLAIQGLRKGTGLADPARLLDLPESLRSAFGLTRRPTPQQLADAKRQFVRLIKPLSDTDRVLASLTWNLDLDEVGDSVIVRPTADTEWLERCAFAADRSLLPWTDKDSIRRQSDRVVFLIACLILGRHEHRAPETLVDGIAGLPSEADPYRQFVSGVLAYAAVLHQEHRDPALLRLRNNVSLTLHILGFHEERIMLGLWALEAAQFLNEKNATISILIDDLGWANYLLGSSRGAKNIERAITFANESPDPLGEPERSLLLAKAHRHLGVITASASEAPFDSSWFAEAERILREAEPLDPDAVKVDLAHLKHAEALGIASLLGINIAGELRDSADRSLAEQGLSRVREARDASRHAGDQGREAKSLVLEVRFLEALGLTTEAEQLAPTRDRAVAASVWSRPAGRVYITGR